MVPGPLRIHDGDGTGAAHAQAVRLGAVDAALTIQFQLFEPFLKVLPGFQSDFQLAAFGLGLVGTDKDVPLDGIDMQFLRFLPDSLVHKILLNSFRE
jgi:hypothetical protein